MEDVQKRVDTKVRVALVSHRYWPFYGGIETHVESLAVGLARRSVEVEVFTTDSTGRLPRTEIREGVIIRRYAARAPSGAYYLSLPLFVALNQLHNFDVVHAHNYGSLPMVMAALSKPFHKVPMVLTPHFHPLGSTEFRTALRKIYLPIGRYALKAADAVVALTEIERSALVSRFDLNPKKVFVVSNGITLPTRRPTKARENMLLVVSRLEEYKGIEILFSALSLIRTRVPDAKLVLVGEGSMRGRIEKLAQGLDDVVLVSSIDRARLVEYYEKSAVLLSVSSYEAFGLSILEAMGHGCPVIATSVGAIPQIIQNMKTGLLLNYPINPLELSNAVVRILTDKTVAELLSADAYELAKREYSVEKMVDRLLSIYESAAIPCRG